MEGNDRDGVTNAKRLLNFSLMDDPDDASGRKKVKVGRYAYDIADDLLKMVYPIHMRRIGAEVIAIDDITGETWSLPKAAQLFGWAASRDVFVLWSEGVGKVLRQDFVHYLAAVLPEISGVSAMPHEPPIAGIHYVKCRTHGDAYSGKLDELIKFWTPHTDMDRSLMKAALCTPFWGGRPGGRPSLCIESEAGIQDDGRGIGKSQFMFAVSNLAAGFHDGHVEGSLNKDISDLKTCLFTDGLKKSVVAFDNCKTSKLSNADLESMITAPTISGRKLYVGGASIPNHFTYMFTMNDGSLSADMASRSVRVVLKRAPAVRGDWQAKLDNFIDANRAALVSDCIWTLRQPEQAVDKCIRFAPWHMGVLSKIDPSRAMSDLLLGRQGAANADKEESGDLADIIRVMIGRYRHQAGTGSVRQANPETTPFLVLRSVMADWLRSRVDRSAADHRITHMLTRARVPELRGTVIRRGSRYWYWRPATTSVDGLKGGWRIDTPNTSDLLAWHQFEGGAGPDGGASCTPPRGAENAIEPPDNHGGSTNFSS